MAWQLVYTSAPRLLDAGRSGFGTVARHREIPQLVVQQVERFSQFARLPDMDPQRTVFSHRIISTSSEQYHVLSMVRSAGADHTGRTNHIAHHLVVAEAEVVRCVTAGITPTDVLLGFPWLNQWTDTPQYLGPNDEVDLHALPHAALPDSHWAFQTGRPEDAWLLVTDPLAARCAWIYATHGTDFRSLLLESLRGQQSTAWLPTFTTELEPTDDASEFTWICSTHGLPVLGSASAVGRAILDLTRPGTLPEPQVPQAVAGVRVAVVFSQRPARSTPRVAARGGWAEPQLTEATPLSRPEFPTFEQADEPGEDSAAAEVGAPEPVSKGARTGRLMAFIGVTAMVALTFAAFSLWRRHEKTTHQRDVIVWLGGEKSDSYAYYAPMAPAVAEHLPSAHEEEILCRYARRLYELITSSPNLDALIRAHDPPVNSEEYVFDKVEKLNRDVRTPLVMLVRRMDLLSPDVAGLQQALGIYRDADGVQAAMVSRLPSVSSNQDSQEMRRGVNQLFVDFKGAWRRKVVELLGVLQRSVTVSRPSDMPALESVVGDMAQVKELAGVPELKAFGEWFDIEKKIPQADGAVLTAWRDRKDLPEWLLSDVHARFAELPAVPTAPPAVVMRALEVAPPRQGPTGAASEAAKPSSQADELEGASVIYVVRTLPSEMVPSLASRLDYQLWTLYGSEPSPQREGAVPGTRIFAKSGQDTSSVLVLDFGQRRLISGDAKSPLRWLVGKEPITNKEKMRAYFCGLGLGEKSPLIQNPLRAIDGQSGKLTSNFIQTFLPKLTRGNLQIGMKLPLGLVTAIKSIDATCRQNGALISVHRRNDLNHLLEKIDGCWVLSGGKLDISELALWLEKAHTEATEKIRRISDNIKSKPTLGTPDSSKMAPSARLKVDEPFGGQLSLNEEVRDQLKEFDERIKGVQKEHAALLLGEYTKSAGDQARLYVRSVNDIVAGDATHSVNWSYFAVLGEETN